MTGLSFGARFEKWSGKELDAPRFFTTLKELQKMMNETLWAWWTDGWRPDDEFDVKINIQFYPKGEVEIAEEDKNASV